MVGSGIGLSTKALNKALQEGKALHKGIKALDKGIKALDNASFFSSFPARNPSLEQGQKP